jgi:hypothetical protein
MLVARGKTEHTHRDAHTHNHWRQHSDGHFQTHISIPYGNIRTKQRQGSALCLDDTTSHPSCCCHPPVQPRPFPLPRLVSCTRTARSDPIDCKHGPHSASATSGHSRQLLECDVRHALLVQLLFYIHWIALFKQRELLKVEQHTEERACTPKT